MRAGKPAHPNLPVIFDMVDRPTYEPVLSSKSADFLVALSKARQRKLIALLYQLAENHPKSETTPWRSDKPPAKPPSRPAARALPPITSSLPVSAFPSARSLVVGGSAFSISAFSPPPCTRQTRNARVRPPETRQAPLRPRRCITMVEIGCGDD